MKRKGYALLLAIEAMFILTLLAAAMVTLASTSYKSSIKKEKLEQLKLKSESAIEKQYVYLKDYIMKNPIVLVDSSKYNLASISKVNENYEGIHIETSLSKVENFEDAPTGRKVNCLKIEARAQYLEEGNVAVGRILKTTVYIDMDSIYNEYFERIFKSSFTTAPKEPLIYGGAIESSFKINDAVNLKTSGNMLLQGTVTLNPSSFEMDEGEIFLKSPKKIEFQSNGLVEAENRISRVEAIEDSDFEEWTSRNADYLYFCPILNITSNGGKPLANYIGDGNPIDDNSLEFLTVDNSDTLMDVQNTVTYKVRSNSGPVSFQHLINGRNRKGDVEGLYPVIINKLRTLYPHLGDEVIMRFGEFYKVLLIDGNLTIEDDKEFAYNNYVIYCSGKVTFEGDAYFYNSSIFAQKIELKGGNVLFNGINTRQSSKKIVGNRYLTDFKSANKGAISEYLLKNIANYGDYLQFRVVKWEQE
ncbi:MAG: hypothetical protein GX895_03955 [Clostridiales bacterium]|uniref:hypothetical protein n=1 Tax=Clostridium sp. N3C TaxID=1776758 RepID=UPI00092E198F|nr:hypothetical protein [Clostridium sp. N3C]NLZ47934.1 hypothetical protein [Clostridiales bacterium]SCN22481.1 hypothetical protein N3C_0810 [Clostridium sp. N3C]